MIARLRAVKSYLLRIFLSWGSLGKSLGKKSLEIRMVRVVEDEGKGSIFPRSLVGECG